MSTLLFKLCQFAFSSDVAYISCLSILKSCVLVLTNTGLLTKLPFLGILGAFLGTKLPFLGSETYYRYWVILGEIQWGTAKLDKSASA